MVRYKAMAGLRSEEEDFIQDKELDWEQAEMDERMCDGLAGLGTGEDTGSRFLDIIWPVWDIVGGPNKTPLQ